MDIDKLIERLRRRRKMEVRPIDANRLAEEIASMHAAGCGTWSTKGLLNLLCRQPTLTPPNEPLTLDELIGMDGEPAWWDAGKGSCWGIICVDSSGIFAGIPFFRGRWRGSNFEYGIEARGMTLYRRPPPGTGPGG